MTHLPNTLISLDLASDLAIEQEDNLFEGNDDKLVDCFDGYALQVMLSHAEHQAYHCRSCTLYCDDGGDNATMLVRLDAYVARLKWAIGKQESQH